MDFLRKALGKRREVISPVPEPVVSGDIVSPVPAIQRPVKQDILRMGLGVLGELKKKWTEPKVFTYMKPKPVVSPEPTLLPEPVVTPKPMTDKERYEVMIKEAWPEDEAGNALTIAIAESKLDPEVVGPCGEYGLFQILPATFKGENIEKIFGYKFEDMKKPIPNIRVAKYLWNKYGWQPWVTAEWFGLK